jgi:hypothetical protein
MLLVPVFLWAGDTVEEPPAWTAMKFFIGAWEGKNTGMSGEGTGEREYEMILNDQFIYFKNRAVFEPQEKNPEGEIHEDWGFFSYDKTRETCVLRQFHGEGYINQYLMEPINGTGDTLIFVTERIENIPEGWRARVSFIKTGDDSFSEIFELAAPGKEFSACVKNFWTRRE